MLQKLFTKKTVNTTDNIPSAYSDKVVNNVSNWYADKYNAILIQRNLLLILLIASVVLVMISTVIVGKVSSGFKIQPFVIEVDSKTGITNIVNPLSNHELITSEVLNKYFITKYIKAREGYSFDSWRYNYLTIVRLLSAPNVYRDFRNFINVSPNSPLALYGSQMSTSVVFRSIQFFAPVMNEKGGLSDAQAVVRFTIVPDKGALKGGVGGNIYKIVTLTYKYQQTEMNDVDRSENPLGFYITSYRADIENEVVPVVNASQ